LMCDDNGNFNAAGDTSVFECSVNAMSENGFVHNGVPNADYSECNPSNTYGERCEPQCRPGFKKTGASANFALICDGNGNCDAEADTGDLECKINTCGGSVSSGVTNADYSACSTLTTRTTCTPVCRAGYATTGASYGFALVCDDNGDYNAAADAGDLRCVINTFDASSFVSNGVPNADYSSCSSTTTSGKCVAKCSPGYAATGTSSGFTLICDDNGDCDAGGDSGNLQCLINTCSGQVWNGLHLTNADYSSCATQETGGICIPVCPAGYKTTGASVGFSLVCRNNGDYNAATDSGTLRCASNICDGIAIDHVTDADYSVCSSQTTGEICAPTCLPGYSTSGSTAGFPLVCDNHGDFHTGADSGDLECAINKCNGQVTNSVAGVDYSSCSSKFTGDTCAPVCPSGTATGVAVTIALVCDDNGDYKTGDLQCTSEASKCVLMRGFRGNTENCSRLNTISSGVTATHNSPASLSNLALYRGGY
jgi:hypothetical protein